MITVEVALQYNDSYGGPFAITLIRMKAEHLVGLSLLTELMIMAEETT